MSTRSSRARARAAPATARRPPSRVLEGAPMPPADPAKSRAAADVPATYGRFRLTGRIGAGGMAEVFRAVVKGPEGWERELVVKRILPQLSGNSEFTKMFIREAKISALLVHPNIVQTFEFGEAEGTYFI